MSGIGGRAPRHLPVWSPWRDDTHVQQATVRPIAKLHRHEYLLPLQIDARTRRVGVMPIPGEWQAAAWTSEQRRGSRRMDAALRREQQRQARIAAGVDRSSPNAGPRPRWSR